MCRGGSSVSTWWISGLRVAISCLHMTAFCVFDSPSPSNSDVSHASCIPTAIGRQRCCRIRWR